MKRHNEHQREAGFTLIELLIAIVVVGVLTAVAIVGIQGLTNKGETASCQATRDAAKAAVAVHYANQNGTYPATFTVMESANEIDRPSGVAINGAGTQYSANNWTLTLGANGALTTGGANAC